MQGSTDLQRLKVPPETTEKGKNLSRILVGDFEFRYLDHNNMIKLIITVSISDLWFFIFIVLELSYESNPESFKWILDNQSHQAKKKIRVSFQDTVEKDIRWWSQNLLYLSKKEEAKSYTMQGLWSLQEVREQTILMTSCRSNPCIALTVFDLSPVRNLLNF